MSEKKSKKIYRSKTYPNLAVDVREIAAVVPLNTDGPLGGEVVKRFGFVIHTKQQVKITVTTEKTQTERQKDFEAKKKGILEDLELLLDLFEKAND